MNEKRAYEFEFIQYVKENHRMILIQLSKRQFIIHKTVNEIERHTYGTKIVDRLKS